MTAQPDRRQHIVDTTIGLMDRAVPDDVSLHQVARAAHVDAVAVLREFDDWETLVGAAHEERFLQRQLALIAEFTHGLRTCRTPDEFVELVEHSLLDAYAADRAAGRAIRTEILGRCRVRPELASTVATANRRATGLLGDALHVAQTRGWVRPDLDTEVAAIWILGQVTGRYILEVDRTRSGETGPAWDRVSIEAVLAVLLGPSVPRSPRRRWYRTTRR